MNFKRQKSSGAAPLAVCRVNVIKVVGLCGHEHSARLQHKYILVGCIIQPRVYLETSAYLTRVEHAQDAG
jgi:hypothetical protein